MNFEFGSAETGKSEAGIIQVAELGDWSAQLKQAPPAIIDRGKGDIGLSRSDEALTVTNIKWLQETRLMDENEKKALFPSYKAKFKEAIEFADQDHIPIESAMEAAVPGFKADNALLESMKGLSESLRTKTPQDRKALIKILSSPEATDSLMNLEPGDSLNVVVAFREFKQNLASKTDKHPATVASAWFKYHESIGDRIGSRQVYVGLLERFGNDTDDIASIKTINSEIGQIKAAHGGDYTK